MACNGVYCNLQCYVNSCTSYVAPNEVWDYGVLFPTAAGDLMHDENIEELRSSINDERTRRGLPDFSFTPATLLGSDEGANPESGDPATTAIVYGQTVDGQNESIQELKDAINGITSGTVTYNVIDGNPVPYSTIKEAKDKIDLLRATCICNSDCGGHLVCTCHNDCGCYYA